jgi:hypothetical protein
MPIALTQLAACVGDHNDRATVKSPGWRLSWVTLC